MGLTEADESSENSDPLDAVGWSLTNGKEWLFGVVERRGPAEAREYLVHGPVSLKVGPGQHENSEGKRSEAKDSEGGDLEGEDSKAKEWQDKELEEQLRSVFVFLTAWVSLLSAPCVNG